MADELEEGCETETADEPAKFPTALKFFAVIIGLVLISWGVAVHAESGKTVSLTAEEKKTAIAYVEQRRSVQMRRQEAQLKYNADMNRLAEEENKINLDYDQFCFSLRKSHSIAYNDNYRINEFKGVMEKQ